MLREQLAKAKADDLLVPQVVYGYFPANGDGNDLVVWKDDDPHRRVAALPVPPPAKAPFLCIADFFRPVESGEADYAAFHIVTMGERSPSAPPSCSPTTATRSTSCLHGLGVEMAEALAEYWHHRIREEWGFADEDGPTSPACSASSTAAAATRGATRPAPTSRTTPRSRAARRRAHRRRGLEETGYQYQPEQTTSAIICHHPQAKYFVPPAPPPPGRAPGRLCHCQPDHYPCHAQEQTHRRPGGGQSGADLLLHLVVGVRGARETTITWCSQAPTPPKGSSRRVGRRAARPAPRAVRPAPG